MSEEKVIEVEVVETVEEAEPSPLTVIVQEAAKLFESLGKALVTTAQDVSNLIIVPVDKVTREQLDMLVETGAAASRRDVVVGLLKEGLQSREHVFGKIEATRAQIAALKQQLRSVAGGQS
jgi:hypothetical protein